MVVYFAAPLFSLAEKEFNLSLAKEMEALRNDLRIALPQEFCIGASLPDIYNRCIENIDLCDLLIGVLDGADADSGTSFEVGYAFAKGKPIVGIRTDFRELEDHGVNLMLSKSCSSFVRIKDETSKNLASLIVTEINKLRP